MREAALKPRVVTSRRTVPLETGVRRVTPEDVHSPTGASEARLYENFSAALPVAPATGRAASVRPAEATRPAEAPRPGEAVRAAVDVIRVAWPLSTAVTAPPQLAADVDCVPAAA
ncbi:hypothetical protein HEK616_76620 (plasmid) [Streptomyces nigrescens]|uniref:Uncharacterized protein n=1 Tax=Streptomyces nigrescens TaxID=1920 RepID=A0ABN6R9C5_STRNI|nr:hypothetical protein HEK616_76620 [Streptomyces nigrescens]